MIERLEKARNVRYGLRRLFRSKAMYTLADIINLIEPIKITGSINNSI